MALIREIIDCIEKSDLGAMNLRLDNVRDAIIRPSVNNDKFLSVSPGNFNASIARLSITIRGCTFVRGKEDPIWHPMDDIDLIGCRIFVNSVRFREMGYDVSDFEGLNCREVSLRVLSDCLNKRKIARVLGMSYSEYATLMYWRDDFKNIRGALVKFHCRGFAYRQGHWWCSSPDDGVGGDDLFAASACALGLIENFVAECVRNHLYVDLPRDLFSQMMEVARNGESRGLESYIRSLVRYYGDDSEVTMLISEEKLKSLRQMLRGSNHSRGYAAADKLSECYWSGESRWQRKCRKELREMEFNAILDRTMNSGLYSNLDLSGLLNAQSKGKDV